MRKYGTVLIVILLLLYCLAFTSCGQANNTSEPTSEPSTNSLPEPMPNIIDYKALAAQLNADVDSPIDNVIQTDEAADVQRQEVDLDRLYAAMVSGSVFEAGDNCIICRFWSAGIDRELFDLLGSDNTAVSKEVYTELLKSFVANHAALQKAVSLYEPDAILVLHVVENSEATDPIIVVENGEVTYDYGTAQGYFVSEEPVGNTPVEAFSS